MMQTVMENKTKEGLSKDKIHTMLDNMTKQQVEEVIQYLTWILETP